MNITINVPDTAIKLQYCVAENDGYEVWKPVTLGDFVSVAKDLEKGNYLPFTCGCGDTSDCISLMRGAEVGDDD